MEGVILRLNDKINRLKGLCDPSIIPNFESRDDTWMDVMGYGLIGLLLNRGLFPPPAPDITFLPVSTSTQITRRIASVYLAGPVDHVTKKIKASGWRELAAEALYNHNVATFSPYHAFNGVFEDAVIRINEAVIKECDAAIVYLPKCTYTVGTIFEFVQLCTLGKDVVVWTDLPTTLYFRKATTVVSQLDEAIAEILKLRG